MDVYARRRAKLALMVDQMNQGNIASFARDYGYSRAQISQFLSKTYNGGRSIGERAARTLEARVGNEPGSLDMNLSEWQLERLEGLSTAELRVIADQPLPGDLKPFTFPERFARIWLNCTVTPRKDGFVEHASDVYTSPMKYLNLYADSGNILAIEVRGSALRPRFKNGEYLICGAQQMVPGDDVLVTLPDEQMAILQYLYERDGEIAFGNVNDSSSSLLLPSDQIVRSSVIVGVLHSNTTIYTSSS